MKNVFACTETGGSYPGYVSVNEAADGLTITVRSPRNEDGSCGAVATLDLTPADVSALAESLRNWLNA